MKADNPIKIVTNAGTRIVSKQAMVAGFGKVWYDEQAIANIFALNDLKKKYHVTYDSKNEHAFIVHKGNRNLANSKVQIMASMFSLYQYVIKTKQAWLRVI